MEAAHTAAVAARTAAFHASIARPNSLTAVRELKAALEAETIAKVAWKAAEHALQTMWRAADDTEYDAFICAQYDAHDYDYDGFDDHTYQLTPEGVQYLDYHYATHSNA